MNSPSSPIQPHDAFVAYNNLDKAFALRIADSLRSAGIRVWIDETEILPGDIFQVVIDRWTEFEPVAVGVDDRMADSPSDVLGA